MIAKKEDAPVIIVGAGLVGAAQALALAKHDIPSVVIDKSSADAVLQSGSDGRVSAISYASRLVLDYCGVWDDMASEAGPIDTILVTENHAVSDIVFDSAKEGDEPFGHMVANNLLRRVLLEQVMDHPAITLLSGETVSEVIQSPVLQVTTASGRQIAGELLIVADGRMSDLRNQLGIKARTFDYNQSAIVCTIGLEKIHHNQAVEWFFPAGPVALLPMYGGKRACIVWTEETLLAQHLVCLDTDEFMEELSRKIGTGYGKLSLESGIYSYPLSLSQAATSVAIRTAIIGDAAHAIHPIAGQGVNLGYRDVAVLTELLVDAQRSGQDPGNSLLLEHYRRWRHFDAVSMTATTDGLNRLFSNDFSVMRRLRRLGMAGFERSSILKSFFMQSAMGMSGDLPKMLADEAL